MATSVDYTSSLAGGSGPNGTANGVGTNYLDHSSVGGANMGYTSNSANLNVNANKNNAADAVGNAPADDGATQRRSLVASTAGTAGRTNLLGRGGGGGSGDTSAAPTLMGRIVK